MSASESASSAGRRDGPGDGCRTGAGSHAESARAITRSVLASVADIARRCRASVILVYVDAVGTSELNLPEELSQKVIYVTKSAEEDTAQERLSRRFLRVPDVPLTRVGQMKIAVFLALSRNLVRPGDIVVFLGGIARSGTLDTILITEVGREFEAYTVTEQGDELPPHVLPEVLERVIDIAAEIGSEGREGKPLGAIFVVGDTERTLSLTRQLILNPFRGYPEEERNLLDPALEETIKELATIDGAFIIRGDGVVETCGAYLKVASQQEFELPRGLGARHHAAAAITAVSDAIAVTVSESTGTVTIFRHGRPITEIEKPRSTARQHERFLLQSAAPRPAR